MSGGCVVDMRWKSALLVIAMRFSTMWITCGQVVYSRCMTGAKSVEKSEAHRDPHRKYGEGLCVNGVVLGHELRARDGPFFVEVVELLFELAVALCQRRNAFGVGLLA